MKKGIISLSLFMQVLIVLAQSYFNVNGISYRTSYSYENPDHVHVINIDPEYTGNLSIPSSISYSGKTYNVSSISWVGVCPGLISINLPSTIESILFNPFVDCPNMTSINVSSSNPIFSSIDGVLYTNRTTNKKNGIVAYPAMKYGKFNIPNGVGSILDYAFANCTKLIEVKIPETVDYIGDRAFVNCTGLTTIEIPNSAFNWGYGPFTNCTGLKTITLPNQIQTIPTSSFENCKNLITISLPASVVQINPYALDSCESLRTIYSFNPIPPNFLNESFRGVDKFLCTLFVPNGSVENYRQSDQWKDFKDIIAMTTAISTVLEKKISLYPNVIQDVFQIKGFEGLANIQIIDINGKMCISKIISENEMIKIGPLPKGFYFIHFMTPKNKKVFKIIKK